MKKLKVRKTTPKHGATSFHKLKTSYDRNKKVCVYCGTTENANGLCGVYKCWI